MAVEIKDGTGTSNVAQVSDNALLVQLGAISTVTGNLEPLTSTNGKLNIA
jgi:hypothetical protein